MSELKPCPFCGGEASFRVNVNTERRTTKGWRFGITCTNCGVQTPKIDYIYESQLGRTGEIETITDERIKAIEAWNRRMKMTYKEARQSILSYCVEECDMIESCNFNVFNNCVEALAIKAIEKQIPKKPSGWFDDETYGRAWVCECTGVIGEYQKFCPCCGQAIDWNRKENEDD